jgi:hypothetical protein
MISIFNKLSLDEFKLILSFEIRGNNFNTENNNIDNMFNTFVNTYLKIFYTCFPTKKIYKQSSPKQLLTTRIKREKRELYLSTKVHDNNNLKQYYKTYSKILTKVIKEAKKTQL